MISGKGLIFNFRDVPLETVLNYMSDAAGYIIHPNKVSMSGKVTAWSSQPLNAEEALKLLNQVLSENGYTTIQEGRTLTIVRSEDAKKSNIKVVSGNIPAGVPKNEEIVTQIIPVRTLNAVALLKDLDLMKPATATLTSDESANSIVMTDTQANIHHFMEIINALDSVTSTSTSIQVFALKFADATKLATLIKDLFPSANSNSGNNAGGFGRFRGFGGGDTGSTEGNGKTPQIKVNAVADDHSNSLVVTAPEDLISTISNLVRQVDQAVEDTTEIRVFHLNNADAGEMADLLTSLFPDETANTSADATRPTFRFSPFGGFGGGQQKETTSERAKKLSKVTAVPDRRTSSLVVTCSKDIMTQIDGMITELDHSHARKQSMHIIPLNAADPIDVQQILQDLLPTSTSGGSSRSGSSSSSTQNNYLLNRANTLLQQQNSTTTSSFGSSSGSGSSSGRGF